MELHIVESENGLLKDLSELAWDLFLGDREGGELYGFFQLFLGLIGEDILHRSFYLIIDEHL